MKIGNVNIQLNKLFAKKGINNNIENSSMADAIDNTTSPLQRRDASRLREIEDRVSSLETRIQNGTIRLSELVECEDKDAPTIIEIVDYLGKLSNANLLLYKDFFVLDTIVKNANNRLVQVEAEQLQARISRCQAILNEMATRTTSTEVTTSATKLIDYYKTMIANGEDFTIEAYVNGSTGGILGEASATNWLNNTNKTSLVLHMFQKSGIGRINPKTFAFLTFFDVSLNDRLKDGKTLREHIVIENTSNKTRLLVDDPSLLQFEYSWNDFIESTLDTDRFVLLSEYFYHLAHKNPNASYNLGYLNSLASGSVELNKGINAINAYFGTQNSTQAEENGEMD